MVEVKDAVAGLLNSAAATLAFALPEDTSRRLLAYLDLLRRWNGVYNLTAIRDPAMMASHHLIDCLAVAPGLFEFLRSRQETGSETRARRLLDVGSGGGLPGVVLAILDPTLAVTCIDTVGKKAAFIRQVAGELGLANLAVQHCRVEAMAGSFDVVTSRAFATLADFCKLTSARLAPAGVWMAMKGRRPDAEIDALPADVAVFHVEHLVVPGVEAERCVVWMRPNPA